MKDNRKYFEIKFTVNGVEKTKQVYCETAIDAIVDSKAEFARVSAERGLDIKYIDCVELGDIYAT